MRELAEVSGGDLDGLPLLRSHLEGLSALRIEALASTDIVDRCSDFVERRFEPLASGTLNAGRHESVVDVMVREFDPISSDGRFVEEDGDTSQAGVRRSELLLDAKAGLRHGRLTYFDDPTTCGARLPYGALPRFGVLADDAVGIDTVRH